MTISFESYGNIISQSPITDPQIDIEQYIYLEDNNSNESALDKFYTSTKGIIIEVNQNTEKYNSSSWLGSFALLAIISATENYTREIFKDIIMICPISQSKIEDKTVRLSSSLWNTKDDLIRVLYEDISFANSKVIKSKIKEWLEIKDLDDACYNSLFKSFDLICNLRHSITHADRIIAGKNAVGISLQRRDSRAFLKINANQINDILSICTNVVLTINRILFINMLQRWKDGWRTNRTIKNWIPTSPDEEIAVLENIYNRFFSNIDFLAGSIQASDRLDVQDLYAQLKNNED